MSFFKTIFKNIHGFNVTETMVGGGIIAFLLLGAGKVTNDYAKANREVETDQLLNFWTERARITLRNINNCNRAVGGSVTPAAGSSTPLDLLNFVDTNDGDREIFDPSFFAAGAGAVNRRARDSNLRIDGVAVQNYIDARGEARVVINFSKIRANGSTEPFPRSFTVKVKDEAGNLLCWDQDDSFQESFEDLICRSLHDESLGLPEAYASLPTNLRERCELSTNEAVARVKRAICDQSMGTDSANCMRMYRNMPNKVCSGATGNNLAVVVGWDSNDVSGASSSGSFVCQQIRQL